MTDLNHIRDRYLKESFDMKLGHLASDLARISSFLENSMNRKAVEDLLEESKFFIEWMAPEASFEIQALLSEMQSKLALWQYYLLRQKDDFIDNQVLKKMTKTWSEQLIETSGLLYRDIRKI